MKNLLYIAFILMFFIFSGKEIYGQQNHTMYGMTKLAQSHYENPAFYANGKFYMGIGLGFHSIGVNNSGFTLNRAFKERSYDDSLMLNTERLQNSFRKMNYVLADVRTEIFGIGFTVKDIYFSLTATNRLNFNFSYPRDLAKLALEGNGRSFIGKRIALDGLGFNLNGYMEYALGFSAPINDKLRIGARLKALSGYVNFSTQKSKLGLTTAENVFDLTLDGQMKFSTAGLASGGEIESIEDLLDLDLSLDRIHELYQFKNYGAAIDLGATYQIDDKFAVNASVLDLGFIKWKHKVANYETDNLDFNFQGVNVNQMLNDSTDYFDELIDTLFSKVDKDLAQNPYSSMLSARFYLGGTYQVGDWLTLGLTSYNQVAGKRLRMAGIASATIQLKNWLGFTVNYAAYGGSFSNIGVGLSLRGGPFQFYVMTDNILLLDYTRAKNAHVTFGLNILAGKLEPKATSSKKKKRRKSKKFVRPNFDDEIIEKSASDEGVEQNQEGAEEPIEINTEVETEGEKPNEEENITPEE